MPIAGQNFSVNVAVYLERGNLGECIAAMAVDVVALRVAPLDEIDRPDVRSDRCVAFPAKRLFEALGMRPPFLVGDREAVPVFHDGFDSLVVAGLVLG